MSKMKSTLAVTLLTLVFALPGLGGNAGTPGGTPPPPPPPVEGSEGSPTSQGPGNMDPIGAISPLTLVDILLAVLSRI
jgi:hypothetical protein